MAELEGVSADSIFYSGKIITVDQKFSISEAFAVKNGRFLAVGKDSAIMSLAGPKTEIYNLKGKTVVPGLIDSHIHFQLVAQERMFVSLEGVKSMADIASRIGEAAKKVKKGEWIPT